MSRNLSNGHLFVEPITDPEITCWTEGLVSISGLPFDELMEKFEQAFDVKIRIELETLPDIRNVSGKIRVNDGMTKRSASCNTRQTSPTERIRKRTW